MITATLATPNLINKRVANAPPAATKPLYRRPRFLVAVGSALLIGALLVGFVPRISQNRTATADTQQLATPTVSIVTPARGAPPAGLILPAEVRPWQEASIYSRVNGYLKSWQVDIGARVTQDQPLAEIDTPDLDHQLEQARSQAQLAKASYQLALSTNGKWQRLFNEGVVSQLDAENTAANQNTTDANAKAFAENLRVLEQEVAFKHVTAPFPGIITARNTNVGDLIVANNVSNEMFHIQQTDPLRIYFRVPQGNAGDVKVGQSIEVVFPPPVGKTVPAKVATTSESITPTTRTLLVELHLPNADNRIQPGSYAETHLPASSLGTIVTVPNNALLFRAQGLQVGVVKSDNKVELRDIKVGRDFGARIEILSGISPADKVIINPSDSLVTGDVVRVAAPPASSPTPAIAKK